MKKFLFFGLLNTSCLLTCSENSGTSTFKYINGQLYSPSGSYILNTKDGYFVRSPFVLQSIKNEARTDKEERIRSNIAIAAYKSCTTK